MIKLCYTNTLRLFFNYLTFLGATLGKLKRCHSLKLLRSRDKEKLSRSNSFKSSGTSPGPNIDFRNDIENVDTAKSNTVNEGFIFPSDLMIFFNVIDNIVIKCTP